jgi:DNA-binding beta-propeller fold protein YncE
VVLYQCDFFHDPAALAFNRLPAGWGYGKLIACLDGMKNVTKEDRMFVKKLLKGSVITGIGVLLLFLAMGKSASAESYSLRNQIPRLKAPLDVAVGPDGRVYIADQSNFRVVQFDEYDAFDESGNFSNECLFQSSRYLPLAVAVDPDGEVYYVTRFGPNGDIIKFSFPDSCDFSEVGTPSQSYYGGVAVAPDGSVFISDFNNDNILKFGPDGSFIKKWGTQGNGVPDPGICSASGGQAGCDAQFNHPKGLAIFGGSELLVADSGNNRIQVFDLDGNFQLAAGSQEAIYLPFNSPDGVAVGPDVNVYVSDTGNKMVEKYASDGTLLAEIGTGTLSKPEGIAVDQGGNVYVADSDNNTVAVFTPDIVIIDNGVSTKTITGHDPLNLSVNLQPDSYWENASAFEVFMWVEAPGVEAYFRSFPLDAAFDNLVYFNSLSEMSPLLQQQTGVPALNNYPVNILDDSSPVPVGTYELHICLDRDVNGTFNPSASVCDSINIVRQ